MAQVEGPKDVMLTVVLVQIALRRSRDTGLKWLQQRMGILNTEVPVESPKETMKNEMGEVAKHISDFRLAAMRGLHGKDAQVVDIVNIFRHITHRDNSR